MGEHFHFLLSVGVKEVLLQSQDPLGEEARKPGRKEPAPPGKGPAAPVEGSPEAQEVCGGSGGGAPPGLSRLLCQ